MDVIGQTLFGILRRAELSILFLTTNIYTVFGKNHMHIYMHYGGFLLHDEIKIVLGNCFIQFKKKNLGTFLLER